MKIFETLKNTLLSSHCLVVGEESCIEEGGVLRAPFTQEFAWPIGWVEIFGIRFCYVAETETTEEQEDVLLGGTEEVITDLLEDKSLLAEKLRERVMSAERSILELLKGSEGSASERKAAAEKRRRLVRVCKELGITE